MEFKQRPMYGETDSSVSKMFPQRNQNRLNSETFQLTFSCNFQFADFPFDSHECPIEYGSGILMQEKMRFDVTMAEFGNLSTKSGGDPIILDNLPFPFEFEIRALATFTLHDFYSYFISHMKNELIQFGFCTLRFACSVRSGIKKKRSTLFLYCIMIFY